MADDLIAQPKVAATFTIRLFEDGNMALEFSGPLAHAPVAEHMLKKALQGLDDERFAVYLKTAQEMSSLVKPAADLNGVQLGPRRLHG